MSEFNFGEKVRAKHDVENMLGIVKKGSIGVTVLSDPKHKEWSKIFFGKELYTFDFDGKIVMTDSDDVEKIETPEPEFKVGDRVKVKADFDYQKRGISQDVRGLSGKVVAVYPSRDTPLCCVAFDTPEIKDWYIRFTGLEKISEGKLETHEPAEPKFSVGDKVRIVKKEGKSNWYALVYDGVEGEIRCIFEYGQGFVKTQVHDGLSFTIPMEFVEKLEPQNIETPKKEKKLERITITLKNRQSAIVIIGNYLSADAEFVYYESRDGKTYEIREDEIIMIVSEDFQND